MGIKQLLSVCVREDIETMAMKRYSTLYNDPELDPFF